MSNAHFVVLQAHEVGMIAPGTDGWSLCLQWGEYRYNDGERHAGYRFIWRRPDGSLQARPPLIPSTAVLFDLLRRASEAGWFGRCEHEQQQVAA